MSVRQIVFMGWVCLALGGTLPAEASKAEERATVGAFIFGVSYGLPVTVATAMLIGSRNMSDKDLRLHCSLLLPGVGPALTAVQIVEEHPLTWVVGGYLCLMSVVQTVGMVLLISGLAEMAGGRGGRRCSRVWPTAGPMGIGLAGVF
jgi:hypothetical protein